MSTSSSEMDRGLRVVYFVQYAAGFFFALEALRGVDEGRLVFFVVSFLLACLCTPFARRHVDCQYDEPVQVGTWRRSGFVLFMGYCFLWAVSSIGTEPPAPAVSMAEAAKEIESVEILVNVEAIDDFKVSVEIETNITEPVELSVSMELQGRDPKARYIGTQFQRVPVKNGRGSVIVDASGGGYLGMKLPSGGYWVDVAFYTEWKANEKVAKKLGIKESVEVRRPVRLGSGAVQPNSVGGAPHSEAIAITGQLRSLVASGRNMEPLRDSYDAESDSACVQKMRLHQRTYDLLGNKLNDLNRSLHLELHLSHFNIGRCITCTPNALTYCSIAEAELNKGR